MSNNYDRPVFDPNSNLGSQSLSSYEEDDKPKGGVLSKIIIALLVLATGGLGYYTYSLNKDKDMKESELNSQKDQIIKELGALKGSYDKVVEDNKNVNQDLLDARERISRYIDSVQNMKLNIQDLARFKAQAFNLTKERDFLIKKNDSLMRANTAIRKDLDSVSVKLDNTNAKADSLARQASKLKEVVEAGSALQISKLYAQGIKGEKNKITDRARGAEKIRVCFTVGGNRIAKSGSRYFYVKIVAPSGLTLGANDSTSYNERTANFSTATNFIYENKSVDVCDFVSKTGKEFEKGTYKITVYDDRLEEVGQTDLVLR
ncbi:hypothetical protein SAMN05444369_110103 [Capnocytophaga haemolytica]|uniref:Chromosome partitioning protein ParA n=1 Tax=Capnocytophaga haemolytica TaxID=45243 RepID=A0AAX2GWB6_9FLAO|nr:hypothetical protein [Capnocytophaga haemolytica]AMD85370.1 hypothetical protein AXF12_07515 [Capnocytophaga haemolytica]SFO13710.1 hypothetical protein SAMN05444369_110103 [Capnocytophaga haemolytica]SNV02370.1 Uncharacterised protein [Capnocytophaga haemolytica]